MSDQDAVQAALERLYPGRTVVVGRQTWRHIHGQSESRTEHWTASVFGTADGANEIVRRIDASTAERLMDRVRDLDPADVPVERATP